MKYANIRYLGYPEGENLIGVGDYIQLLAIDYLYKVMGKQNIEMIDLDQIETYHGEYLILPINQLISGEMWLKKNGDFRFSDRIIPVFVGVSFRKGFFEFTQHNIDVLQRSSPVGCRDYYTYKQVTDHNIPAYISGCLSLTLPKKPILKGKNTILVDVPEALKEYIPDKLLENDCEIKQQVFQVAREEFYDRNYARELTKKVYEYYVSNAKLIITSRLHCAAPCLAMGIPVVVAKQYKGYTFDWLDKFIKIYSEEDYSQIDWNVQAIEIENYKKKMLNIAAKRLLNTEQKYSYLEANEFFDINIDSYQENEMSITHFVAQIEERYSHEEAFNYAIWGVSSVADKIYEYLRKTYPNARLIKVIDSFEKKVFKGIESESPQVLHKHDDFLVIVTTINCMDSGAKPLFEKIGKPTKEYIYVADEFIKQLK